jgi:serine/threonine-protein phosphatase 6 regulatory ankyrin repeat subunit B
MNAAEVVHEFLTAIRGGHVEELARLLDADPHLMEARDEVEGNTPLVVAADHGHAGVVSLLLERGADVNASDIIGYTALQYTAEQGHEEVVSILLSRGADFSGQSLSGFTALICASFHGHLGVVLQLFQHMAGRGLDERNRSGRTALWGACFNGHVKVARFLLLAGADHTIADNHGMTPRQAAELFGDSACVPLLEVSGTCSVRLQGHAFGKRMERRAFVYIRGSLITRTYAVV